MSYSQFNQYQIHLDLQIEALNILYMYIHEGANNLGSVVQN